MVHYCDGPSAYTLVQSQQGYKYYNNYESSCLENSHFTFRFLLNIFLIGINAL